MKTPSLVWCVLACLVLPACGKSKTEQCNSFVDRATQAQKVVNGLKLDSENVAELEKGAGAIEAEAKAFGALELKDEKLLGFRSSYAATLASLGKIMRDLSALQKDSKDPSKAERLDEVLYNLAEVCRILAVLLWPFLPGTATKINEQLGLAGAPDKFAGARWGGLAAGHTIGTPAPLFPRKEA